MTPNFRIISIGALAAHPLWNERGEVRTGHATTTLVSIGDARILVDPSLPAAALAARLHERAGLQPRDITDVFMTSLDYPHRRALEAFDQARWLAFEAEREAQSETARRAIEEARAAGDNDWLALARRDLAVLSRIESAPDSLAPGVDLFPLPGVTPGTCGLLLPAPRAAALICGDAVPTSEHVAQRKVLPTCWNIERAQESFREAMEIAEVLVPGRDNLLVKGA